MHDKTLFFFDRKPLAAAANTEITSKLIDMRFNGDDVDGRLFINAQLGSAPSEGVVRFKLLTSYDGSSWVDLLTVNNSGATLYKGRLPHGIRRYLKAEAKVTTGLGEANTVFAEITDAIENDLDMNLVQKSSETDQAAAGDAVRAVVEA